MAAMLKTDSTCEQAGVSRCFIEDGFDDLVDRSSTCFAFYQLLPVPLHAVQHLQSDDISSHLDGVRQVLMSKMEPVDVSNSQDPLITRLTSTPTFTSCLGYQRLTICRLQLIIIRPFLFLTYIFPSITFAIMSVPYKLEASQELLVGNKTAQLKASERIPRIALPFVSDRAKKTLDIVRG